MSKQVKAAPITNVEYKADSFSIIDEWMAPSSSKKLSIDLNNSMNFIDKRHNSTNINSSAGTAASRLGLGSKLKKPPTSSNSTTTVDPLQSRIENQQKQKLKKGKRHAEDDDDNDNRELHGMVEQEEESKLKSISKKQKLINNNNNNNNKQQLVKRNTNAKTDSLHSNNQQLIVASISDVDDDEGISLKVNELTKNYKSNNVNNNNLSSNIHANDAAVVHPSFLSSSSGGMVDVEVENNDYSHHEKKRTKTRSKQKNIRRDNRPDDAKPKYLQKGSENYMGRPLTKETMEVLKGSRVKGSTVTATTLTPANNTSINK